MAKDAANTRKKAADAAWDLGAFSRSLEASAKRREDEHRKFNDALPPPDFFLPEEDPQCGLGWFVQKDGWAVAYRKRHNGYETTPSFLLHKDTITALYKAFKSKD